MYKFPTRIIVLSGVFIALIIIFTHVFAIQTPFIRISLAFLPLAVYCSLCGPYYGACTAVLADILGCIIFTPGIYFPGFTLSSIISALAYGYAFHNKNISLKRICITFIFLFVFVDLFLNTIWLSMLYHKAAMAFFLSRLVKNTICLPINIALFSIVRRAVEKYCFQKQSS